MAEKTAAEQIETVIAPVLDAYTAEWGVYVATEPIFINGVRAFNKGHAVPKSHVDRGVVALSQVTTRKGA